MFVGKSVTSHVDVSHYPVVLQMIPEQLIFTISLVFVFRQAIRET